MSKFKYTHFEDGEIKETLSDISKILGKYDSKLRFLKKANVLHSIGGLDIHYEMEPVNKYSRSTDLYAFEGIIEKIEKEVAKKMGDIRVELSASACDLEISLYW